MAVAALPDLSDLGDRCLLLLFFLALFEFLGGLSITYGFAAASEKQGVIADLKWLVRTTIGRAASSLVSDHSHRVLHRGEGRIPVRDELHALKVVRGHEERGNIGLLSEAIVGTLALARPNHRLVLPVYNEEILQLVAVLQKPVMVTTYLRRGTVIRVGNRHFPKKVAALRRYVLTRALYCVSSV